jgi:hypothetical protein
MHESLYLRGSASLQERVPMTKLNHLNYYRLPWNLADNAIAWLEPTAKCNLACYGCYRQNQSEGHKSLDQIKEDLDVFQKFRKFDAVSIAGGDPLVHPDIVEIVRLIKERGAKPIINTNGLALTKELLQELKKAGVFGFTFHIDSKQNRPGWKQSSEIELNELRYRYARMVADSGGIVCSFNSTVYQDTAKFVPDLARWAERNIDIVQVMVFILYRAIDTREFDFYVAGDKLHASTFVYNDEPEERIDIRAEEVYDMLRAEYPGFDSCAYLNGTEQPDSFKWLLSGRFGTKERIYGYMGPKGMELIQTINHLVHGTYLGYASPRTGRMGKTMLLLGAFDRKVRSAFKEFYSKPLNVFKRLHYQSVMVIQPIDLLEDGRQNMCDSCPDITVWNGQLVWSCRMDEQLKLGCNMASLPRRG